jgi:GNAT superfamily N-acetyltransferase
MSEMNIRRAIVTDAATIAGVHVRAWQWAYRGLIPDAFLDGLSIEARETSWRRQLEPDYATHTWLAEVDGRALGFVTCGPGRDATSPAGSGEVYAIYQEQDAAGTGVGRALMSHAMNELRARGFTLAVLWVLENNARARRFYEIAGWQPDGERKEDHRIDHVRHEVRYRTSLVVGSV